LSSAAIEDPAIVHFKVETDFDKGVPSGSDGVERCKRLKSIR